MGTRGVRESTDDIAGWVIIAPEEFSILHDIHKSDQRVKIARRRVTHSGAFGEDGAGRTSDKDASNTRGTLPNDLGEMRGSRTFGVIILGFVLPHVDPLGDAERTSSSSQVLCKT